MLVDTIVFDPIAIRLDSSYLRESWGRLVASRGDAVNASFRLVGQWMTSESKSFTIARSGNSALVGYTQSSKISFDYDLNERRRSMDATRSSKLLVRIVPRLRVVEACIHFQTVVRL